MSESPAPPESVAPPESGAKWFVRGIGGAATSVQAWVLFATFIGFGGLIRGLEFPFGAALLSTVLIFALPAQVLLVGGWAAGNAAPAIAFAVALSSVRLFPMTASLLPYLRNPRGGLGAQLFAAHFVAVTAWVEAIRRLPDLPMAGRLPYFMGLGCALVFASSVATSLGYALAGTLPAALAAGLLFLTPISFLLQLVNNARLLMDRMALVFGLLLAPVMAEIAGRLDLLWTGVIGGGLAFALHRLHKRKPSS